MITLGRAEFRDKVHACWLGKNIGGTLGAPHEGKPGPLALDYYDPLPAGAAPNDDLDLQLVWLAMLEEVGVDPRLPHFADAWRRMAAPYPWNEYGFAMRNLERGLTPPMSGCFENYYVDEMGSPIRSEIWACLCPADPDRAAELAWRDSAVDHAGGEGTWGEMFWAAVQSAAFVERDPLTLIRIGLNVIPIPCRISRAVREALWCHSAGLTWAVARDRIAARFGNTLHPCDGPVNHAFTILGWLYGDDFGDKLCKAVNCGFDTDCTGATLGATLGIISGTAGIPARWVAPVGQGIATYHFTLVPGAPKTIDDLTGRTVALAERAASDRVGFGDETRLPPDLPTRLFSNARALLARSRDPHVSTALVGTAQLELHYGGEPVIHPQIEKTIEFTLEGGLVEILSLTAPPVFSVRRVSPSGFAVLCGSEPPARSTLTVRIPGGEASFTLLGPSEARGFPAGENVAKCADCHARVEACVCSAEILRARPRMRWCRDFLVAGPFHPATPGQISLDEPTPLDRALAFTSPSQLDPAHWRPVKADDQGMVDFDGPMGRHEYAIGFAATVLESDQGGPTTLLVASDDGIRLALNGRVILEREVRRAIGSVHAVELLTVPLRPGRNLLTAKIDNYVGGWGIRLGYLTPESAPK